MANGFLQIENLTKVFKIGGLFLGTRLSAIDNVSLLIQIDPAVILSIVGESGSGKTTLARMILRLCKPTSGEIYFRGRNIWSPKGIKTEEFKRLIQPVFQNPFEAFNPYRRVESYLYETTINLGKGQDENVKDSIGCILSLVGFSLERVQGKYPYQFSGGELQRIAIARSLIPRPELIVADEPVAMIDASSKMNIINLFRDLKRRRGVSTIYVTHDLSTAYYLSDYIAVMFRGEIVEYGSAELVLNDPRHPYTEELLDSVPRIGERWSNEKVTQSGENKRSREKGCKFLHRCPRAKQRCSEGRPPRLKLEDGRTVLCHFAQRER